MSQVTITNTELLEVFAAWVKSDRESEIMTPEDDAAERAEVAARYFVELLTEVRREAGRVPMEATAEDVDALAKRARLMESLLLRIRSYGYNGGRWSAVKAVEDSDMACVIGDSRLEW